MVLYQTIEDRNNPDQIEANAPFKCLRKDAWLGHGYYFWDTFIENAHWWGKTNYSQKGYVILKFICEDNYVNLFDLHGNMNHVKYFKDIVNLLHKQGLLNSGTTVAWIIEYLKKHTDFAEQYEAIRIYGHYSKSLNNTEKRFFSKNRLHYFELTPAVQLCLFNKNSLNLKEGEIIFPSEYVSDIVI